MPICDPRARILGNAFPCCRLASFPEMPVCRASQPSLRLQTSHLCDNKDSKTWTSHLNFNHEPNGSLLLRLLRICSLAALFAM